MTTNNRFNASISVIGVSEPKVQQALLKLLENSLHLKDLISRDVSKLRSTDQELRQMISGGSESEELRILIAAAQATATSALQAANSAQTTANSAQTSATSAQTTANSAQTTATSAQTTATSAQTTANSAQTTATSAQTTARSALQAANSAQTTANSAQTSATSAQTTATSAQTTAASAQSTATYAQNLATSAQDASEAAQETADSALSATKKHVMSFKGVDLMAGAYRRIYLSEIVPDVTKTYSCVIKFFNTTTTARSSLFVKKNGASSGDGVVTGIKLGKSSASEVASVTVPSTEYPTTLELSQDDYMVVDNIVATVDVIVTCTEKEQ